MDAALFVYGTLKRGFSNHDRYCLGAKSIRPATVWGRLYHLSYGYPLLVIPPETALAWGTADRSFDVARLAQVAASIAPPVSETPPHGDWTRITGELIVFDDLAERFVGLDSLEGYAPEGRGHYDRAVVWTLAPEPRLAWTYVAPHGRVDSDAQRIGWTWPA